MPGRILPYTAEQTAEAARWLDHVAAAFTELRGEHAISATVEAIQKLEWRGLICPAVAALMSEVYDVQYVANDVSPAIPPSRNRAARTSRSSAG